MDHTDQETNLDRLFEAARQAHESGNLYKALELYTAVSRQNPYYPGLESHMRALEMQMTRGPVSDQQVKRSERSRQRGSELTTGYSHPPQSTQDGFGCVNPYVFYGAIAFFPSIILTWFIHSAKGWDLLFTWLLVHNVVTFFIYGYDKLIAPSGIMRVPDSILLLEVLMGAFIGAPLAREVFRHKTQKLPFRHRFWVVEIISIAWVVICYISLARIGYSWLW